MKTIRRAILFGFCRSGSKIGLNLKLFVAYEKLYDYSSWLVSLTAFFEGICKWRIILVTGFVKL